MKKITYLLLIVIGMVFYCSCSTEDITNETEPTVQSTVYEPETQALIDFQTELAALNEQMFTGQSQTRGLSKFMKRFLAVVCCDALGGGLGGCAGGIPGAAVGAITSSVAAAIAPEDKLPAIFRSTDDPTTNMLGMNDPDIALSPNLIPTTPTNPTGPTIEDSIGYYHNVVILALNNTLPSENVDIDTLIENVAELTYKSYHTTQKAVINHLKANESFFVQLTSNIMPNIKYDNDFSDIIKRCQLQFPEQAEKLKTIEIYINGLTNIEITDNDGEYLNKALALLNASAMDPTTKRDVRNALIVANASYQLWESSEN